jgi:RNA polymerase sigma factor (TIGR02999 family)
MPDGQAELLAQVYDQLRAIARQRLAMEAPGHTLQATALVNEAYLKLQDHPSLKNCQHAQFLHVAAEAMRRVLVDHARTKKRIKRGGGARRDITDVASLAADEDPQQILSLDDAIRRFEGVDPQAASVVKLRFYAGLSIDEVADALGVSSRTVKRDWQFARAWLFDALKDD